MKLYTERQMKEMFRMGLAHSTNEDGALEQFAPIELPSDEEVDREIEWLDNPLERLNFKSGIRWMRDKIRIQGR